MLKPGDRIRITAVPGEGEIDYHIHRDTIQVYKKIIARKRAVRIDHVDEDGTPWYQCRFRRKNGRWEFHWLAVYEEDVNWVRVKSR